MQQKTDPPVSPSFAIFTMTVLLNVDFVSSQKMFGTPLWLNYIGSIIALVHGTLFYVFFSAFAFLGNMFLKLGHGGIKVPGHYTQEL